MTGGIYVLLPAHAAHLAPLVARAGCTAVVDATGSDAPSVPDGAWVRTRPGRPAPGTGPVLLAELGAPIPGRPTWLETSAPRPVPQGYAGVVLKGSEAGGLCGTDDGLVALAQCPEPGRVILDAGVGPDTAAAAAALGAAGVLLVEPHLGCPELGLPEPLLRRLRLADDEVAHIVGGVRVANSPTAPVLRELARGADPWSLADGLYTEGDPQQRLWMAGQGLALAAELADRHGGLEPLLLAYREAWIGWTERARAARATTALRTADTAAALDADSAATAGGRVGSAVLWQEARFLARPVTGGPLPAAMATGAEVVADADALEAARGSLPAPPAAPPAPAAPPPVVAPRTVDAPTASDTPAARPAIAIIGLGCIFPGGANSPEAFWDNVVSGRSAIGDVPPERWDPSLYYDPEREAPDRTYTRIGGFLTDFVFEPKRFRIPPRVAAQVDPVQQITLTAVGDALRDAGLQVDKRDKDGRPFERERCAVILGNSLGGEVSDLYAMRLAWPAIERQLTENPTFAALDADRRRALRDDLERRFLAHLPIIDEDSMPGELANVIAGRITNAFDLGGANYTVDAACASSMAAIDNACKALASGEADVAITGGADRSMNIATYVKFCKIGALSPDHSAPFDASANGFVMGEGAGILVLRRYEDAVAAGDKIYAVIRGIGASSDGKGKGITAPNIQGQIRALQRAYEAAGLAPDQIDLVEAHGTSTVVGDQVEVEALTKVLGPGSRAGREPIRIGSVKSMIGHLKSAAGAASCIKTALALHHGVLPPSLGFRGARETVPLDQVPLRVQTAPEPWPTTPDGVRRAGVSAFGFGGTNFHVVMEAYTGRALPQSVALAPPAPQPPPAARPAPTPPRAPVAPAAALPDGIWATSGRDTDELVRHLKLLAEGLPAPFDPSSPMRVAAAALDADERQSQLERAIKTLEKGSNPDMLRGRGIHVEDGPIDGKLALLFTGQGSQYADMGLDLAAHYPIVAETFAEADRVVAPTLGRPITDFIRLAPGEDKAEKEAILKRTEYSQPATLTLDVALLRLLAAYGVQPDMVAGHSLGEYGAAVAAGVLTFEQALLAVSARGREMANIRLDDPGKMAGIATNIGVVEEVLAEVDGYVIAANKNCPSQTVIAGASDAVDEAVERFRARGITVHPLPVSHAFHSSIVAPASEPLRGVLERLAPQAPRRPITTNVTGDWYPEQPAQIVDLLAEQISSPVEWVAQTERMYEAGARIFVECGPKRALAGFTVAILKRRPHRALYTNHPKHGGLRSFLDALAALVAAGFPVRAQPTTADLFAPIEPRRATTEAIQDAAQQARSAPATATAPDDVADAILAIVAEQTGYAPAELDLDYELEADLGIDTVKQAEVFARIREAFQLPERADFDPAAHRTLRSLIDWAAAQMGASSYRAAPTAPGPAAAPSAPPAPPTAAPPIDASAVTAFLESAAEAGLSGAPPRAFAESLLPAVQGLLAAAWEANQMHLAPTTRTLHEVVCAGASLGLPGGDEVFGDANLVAILRGENRIDPIEDRARLFLEKGIVRLVKDPQTGQGSFLPVESLEQVIRLAGIKRHFDLGEWGIDANTRRAFDITTELAIAAGLDALRDAGIPLVRTQRTSATGKTVPGPWQLPEALRDSTGVIFASAFPGYDELIRHLGSNGDDGEGRFERRFLFQVLAMGHSQFAQLIGARGPNTAINAACASSTQAVAVAEDWIRLGRCERVLVIGADDVTSEQLLPWIGSGFMAAGAATTSDRVEEAALPFDRRRHGLILGMGAVGMVLERGDLARARGVEPVATLLSSRIVNSAFHGSRLDIEHISGQMRDVVAEACRVDRVTPTQMARDAFFMSHETYTPARGGSSAAEISALRAAFGDAAAQVTITNTKGFTGHAMGAGVEDCVAVKALQYGVVPPLANLREPDPDLGALTLSRGELRDFRYGVRLAAGFGSQLALTVWKQAARGDARVPDPAARAAWLRRVTGYEHVEERVEQRTLRVYAGDRDQLHPLRPEPTPATLTDADFVRPEGTLPAPPRPTAARRDETPAPGPAAAPPTPAAAPPAPTGAAPADGDVLGTLLAVIAEKTGYGVDELEPDFELEADLGIDTVKQAEVLSELTERYQLPQDDGFRLADHPTIEALAAYVQGRRAHAPGVPTAAAAPRLASPVTAPPPPAATTQAPAASTADVLPTLLTILAEKTGYAIDELEPDFELEADLGVDTVKQAEVLSELTERYQLPQDDGFRLADHPTIEALAAYVQGRVGGAGPVATTSPAAAPTPTAAPAPPLAPAPAATSSAAPAAVTPGPNPAGGDVHGILLAVVAEKTGYEVDELEPDFELEADLGVDTVKQAEIIGELRERLQLEPDDDFRLSDAPTIEALSAYLSRRVRAAGAGRSPVATAATPPVVTPAQPGREAPSPAPSEPSSATAADPEALPSSFRIRRPVLVDRPTSPTEQTLLDVRVLLLGDGPLADAVRDEIALRSGSTEGPYNTVIDLGDDALASFRAASSLEQDRPSRWLSVTRLGGLEPQSPARAWADGARAGFTKALGREWERCDATVLDIGPDDAPADAARVICDELRSERAAEVFVAEGRRQIVRYRTVQPPSRGQLDGEPVLLITGGARGICAEIAKAFAARGPCRLHLVGRSEVPDRAWDLEAEKTRIRAELTDRGERATPAAIERQLGRLRRANEAVATIEALRAHPGVQVRYHAVDLADADAAAELGRAVLAEHGRVDVCVHGAGVEESRLIADKDEAAWRRVFDGKAVGGRALLEVLPEATVFVSMGSVAGRFGNPGQVDYAAANDAMARRCLAHARALHVDWTAWDDVGMAADSAMRRILVDRGVDLLPARAGAALLVDLVAAGVHGELVVAGGLGDFEVDAGHPLLDRIELDGDIVRGYRELSLERAPWLADHAIDGVPLLPGVLGLELMAAVACILQPACSYIGAHDVRFEAPIKVHGDQRVQLVVEAEQVGPTQIHTRLIGVRTLRTGRVQRTQHFSATIQLGVAAELDPLPSAFLPDEQLSRAAIYSRFFHGPIFQVLTGVLGISADGLCAEAETEPANIAPHLLTAPLVLEAAFQAAGLHQMVTEHSMGLPMGIDELRFIQPPEPGERFQITVRRHGDRYDIDVDGLSAPLMRVRGYMMAERGPLPPGHRFDAPPDGRPLAFPVDASAAPGGDGPRAQLATADAEAQADAWLTPDELSWLRSRGTARRQADRIAGRIAAKRALHALTGVGPHAIRIPSAPSGEPLAQVPGWPQVAVSISHRDGRAVAVAVDRGRIGVDLEQIEARPPSFARTWLDAHERTLTGDDPLRQTLVWAAKEATLKALGTGMAIAPAHVQVRAIGAERLTIVLRGPARERWLALGGGSLSSSWSRAPEGCVLVRVDLAA